MLVWKKKIRQDSVLRALYRIEMASPIPFKPFNPCSLFFFFFLHLVSIRSLAGGSRIFPIIKRARRLSGVLKSGPEDGARRSINSSWVRWVR